METVKRYVVCLAMAVKSLCNWQPRKRWDRLFRDL